MPVLDDRATITVSLPRSMMDELNERASSGRRSLEAEVTHIIERYLRRRQEVQEALERARTAYEAELARTGQRRPTSDELWEQMRRIREEVANELYPD